MEFSKTDLRGTRSLWTYSKVQAFIGNIVRNRKLQVNKDVSSMGYLNVGCGPFPTPGFCNIDYGWRPGVLAFDITRGIPLPNRSLCGIFSEHCLEHISHSQCVAVLCEFRRILKIGGVARIVVPDGELYCRLYLQAQGGCSASWPYAENGKLPMHYMNRIMRDHGHRFIYDFDSMKESLLNAGFRDVMRERFRSGLDPKLLIDQEHRAVESLYVEATA